MSDKAASLITDREQEGGTGRWVDGSERKAGKTKWKVKVKVKVEMSISLWLRHENVLFDLQSIKSRRSCRRSHLSLLQTFNLIPLIVDLFAFRSFQQIFLFRSFSYSLFYFIFKMLYYPSFRLLLSFLFVFILCFFAIFPILYQFFYR